MTDMTTHVLWTGGWDSTFRVLQAMLLEGRSVQPYYVIDLRRTGFPQEIRAMARIKRRTCERFPETRDRLLPLEIFQLDDIPKDPHSESMYQSLLARGWLGDQIEWLSRFARWRRIANLELAIHRDDRAHEFLRGHISRRADGHYHLTDPVSEPALELYRPFVFPILAMTKVEIGTHAREHGFSEILEETWFCHTPDARGLPCGQCNPCRDTADEGLARRIPRRNRLKYRLRRIVERIGFLRGLLPGSIHSRRVS